MAITVENSLEGFGPAWDPLFATGAGLQTSRAWFGASAAAALPEGSEPRYIAVSDGLGPLLLFAMVQSAARARDATFQSLTTPYTCLWQPLVRPGASEVAVRHGMRMVGGHCRGFAVTRLEALDPDWPFLPAMLSGFRRAGLACRTYDHFGNWYAPVTAGWDSYLQQRPGALRETIRRKTRIVDREPGLRIEVARSPAEIAAAMPAYEAVYARSWKQPEPFPEFNTNVAERLAQTGGMRLFVLWSGDRPLAAQYWTLAVRSATVLKLAHDEHDKRLSPGTVLTAAAIRHLIEVEGIEELDFGRGDDPYKPAWTGMRRRRIGVLGLDVVTLRGVQMMLRHDLGRLVRYARERMKIVRDQRHVN